MVFVAKDLSLAAFDKNIEGLVQGLLIHTVKLCACVSSPPAINVHNENEPWEMVVSPSAIS